MANKINIENYKENILKAEKIIDYAFRDKSILLRALTHPSAVHKCSKKDSYQTYEFLGDSILGCIVAIGIFREYPDLDEGEMTKMKVNLVSGKSLSKIAKKMGLSDCIIFGKSVENTGTRGLENALEDVYEALIAAIFLDGGAVECWQFVDRTLIASNIKNKKLSIMENPKSILQEHCQVFHNTPEYVITTEEGPDHNKTFYVDVKSGNKVIGNGSGKSKKEAEIQAAKHALINMSDYYKEDLCILND